METIIQVFSFKNNISRFCEFVILKKCKDIYIYIYVINGYILITKQKVIIEEKMASLTINMTINLDDHNHFQISHFQINHFQIIIIIIMILIIIIKI